MRFDPASPLGHRFPEALADGILLLVAEKIQNMAVPQILRGISGDIFQIAVPVHKMAGFRKEVENAGQTVDRRFR